MQLPEGEFFPTYMAMSLHIWMVLVRLRTQGRDGRRQMQMLYEQFQEEVTNMVKKAGVKVCVMVFYIWFVFNLKRMMHPPLSFPFLSFPGGVLDDHC